MKIKRCKRCENILPNKNKSDFCRHCYILDYAKKMRKRRVENKCCAECGEKVKPKIVYHYRCDECLQRANKGETLK